MAKDGSPRFLIVRLSHLGDAVLTLPLANQLRSHWPNAYLAWAAEPATARFLEGHPAVDEFLPVPPKWLRRWSDARAIRRTVVSRQLDAAIDPQSLLKSALIPWLGGVRTRIGFDGIHAREGSRWFHNVRVQPTTTHLVDRTLELLRPLGIPVPSQPVFDFPVARGAWESIRPDLRVIEDRSFVTINPGAGWSSRRWPPDRYGKLSHWLHQSFGLVAVVAWAGAAEEQMAREIVAHSSGSAIMAPPTNLSQLTALLAHSQYYVGGDTGPMHIAAAVGTACVVLHGPTRPQDSGAYGPGHLAIVARHAKSGRRRAKRSSAAIESITVDEVMAALEGFLPHRSAA